MNKENCALNLVDELILYYDVRSKKHQNAEICIGNTLLFSDKMKQFLTILDISFHLLVVEYNDVKIVIHVAK